MLLGIAPVREELRVATIPRDFKGVYKWGDQPERYNLALRVDKVERKGAVISFVGTHRYTLADVVDDFGMTMKVEGAIDLERHTISLHESEPSPPAADTNGSFEGTISEDLQTINAVWTSRGSGRTGALTLRAQTTPNQQ